MSRAAPTPSRPTAARRSSRQAVAFRCEAVAQDLSGSREIMLGFYRGGSPRLAARWLRSTAQHLAALLAPLRDGEGPLREALFVEAGPRSAS